MFIVAEREEEGVLVLLSFVYLIRRTQPVCNIPELVLYTHTVPMTRQQLHTVTAPTEREEEGIVVLLLSLICVRLGITYCIYMQYP